jgi:two-component system, cell cycle response regulator CpdR
MGRSKPLRGTAIVVEDDLFQREMIALLLQESDFDVIQCEDAETAALALRRHPALLVTDVKLTGRMNGIELAHIARRTDPNVRVIVVSGNPPASALPDGTVFFPKPIYPVALIQEATH